jgi:hypothetical protein
MATAGYKVVGSSAVRDPDTSQYYTDKQWYGLMKGDKFPVDIETELKILTALRSILSIESRWAKGALCRLGGGKSWHRVSDPNVTCWCIVGALDRIKDKNYAVLGVHADRLYNKLTSLASKLGFKYLEDFNDDPRVTHEHLKKFLEKAEQAIGEKK